MSKELIERLREAAAQRVASTAMIGAADLSVAADALEQIDAAYASAVEASKSLAQQALKAEQERDALAAELKALRARAIELEAETKSSEEMQTLKFCEREWSTERAAMMNTIHALRNCGDAHPVHARELTDADIALCIASADKSFAQERISGKPVLGVWSKHLARAIERHLKGEGK